MNTLNSLSKNSGAKQALQTTLSKNFTMRHVKRCSVGTFHNVYESAMIVVADGSRNHTFFEGLKLLRQGLLSRFGPETDIYLVPIRLQ